MKDSPEARSAGGATESQAQDLPPPVLACDVHLPPNTYIRKGVDLATLLIAIELRKGRPDEDTTFPRRPSPKEEMQGGEMAAAQRIVEACEGKPRDYGLIAFHADAEIVARALLSAPKDNGETNIDGIVMLIQRDVAELPDRSSPEDQPDMMLVTADELDIIVRSAFSAWRAFAPKSASRDDVLEEAAKVADKYSNAGVEGFLTAGMIARDIRSLVGGHHDG